MLNDYPELGNRSGDGLTPDKLAEVFDTSFGSVKTPTGKTVFYAD